MRVCRHCKQAIDTGRSRPPCPKCGKLDKEESTCRQCGKTFYHSPSAKGMYCSTSCSNKNNPKTHGDSASRLYCIWCGMKGRCSTDNETGAEYYSGRGIRVCRAWRRSFEAFKQWALSNGYKEDLELDRRKNNEDYSPENCRWATRQQQMQNTRKKKGGLSKYRGVALTTAGRWRATGFNKGETIHLGVYTTQEEAAKAYDVWAKQNFGQYASLNFKEV